MAVLVNGTVLSGLDADSAVIGLTKSAGGRWKPEGETLEKTFHEHQYAENVAVRVLTLFGWGTRVLIVTVDI